jgi:hypothetical protein
LEDRGEAGLADGRNLEVVVTEWGTDEGSLAAISEGESLEEEMTEAVVLSISLNFLQRRVRHAESRARFHSVPLQTSRYTAAHALERMQATISAEKSVLKSIQAEISKKNLSLSMKSDLSSMTTSR